MQPAKVVQAGPAPKCGALGKRNGKPCKNPRGFRTDHPGVGNCYLHLGNTKNGKKAAAREWAAQLGVRLSQVGPVDVAAQLNHALYRSMVLTSFFEQQFLDAERRDAVDRVYPVWERERRHHLDIIKAAASLGLAERELRLAEDQARLLGGVIRAILADPELGLSAGQREAAPQVVYRHLSAIEAGVG